MYVEPNLRARLRAGDPDAFGALYDEYAHAVYNLGFRLTANWSAAEEVVSLTFLEAWRLRDRIDPGSEPLRPWLLGIAANVSRNLARTSRRHQAALSRLPPPSPVPDFADGLAGQLDDSARLREVGKALGRAPPRRARGHRAVRLVGAGLRHGRQGTWRAGRHRPFPAVAGAQQAQEAAARRRGTRGRPRTGTE
jgi:DNA-directed RNA polymerase specialized sigma24 family protein